MSKNIADIRTDYTSKPLGENDIDPSPIRQFDKWWREAVAADLIEVNAMTLATASTDGMPSARIVLMKGFSERGFLFYTNYDSFKGQQLIENPRACLVFFWKEIHRQVRITGITEKTTAHESDSYFHSRPKASQVGAVASPQSQVIESREWLDKKYAEIDSQYANIDVERPNHWGGFLLKPVIIEFWQGRPSRMHDRIQYSLIDDGTWKIERLAP